MSPIEIAILDQINSLAEDINLGRIEKSAPWGGAGILIAEIASPPTNDGSFYPKPREVITPYTAELSWLLEKLTGIFAGAIDYRSKYNFYSRLADAADKYSTSTAAPQTARDLLIEVLEEAKKFSSGAKPNKTQATDD